MAQVFGCPECQQNFQVPDDAAGLTFQCPACEANVQIPAEEDAASDRRDENVPAEIFACPHCEGQFGITDDMFGTELECPHCEEIVAIGSTSDSFVGAPEIKIDAPPTDAADGDIEPAVQQVAELDVSKKRASKWRGEVNSSEPPNIDASKKLAASSNVKPEFESVAKVTKPESIPVPQKFEPLKIDHLLPPKFAVADPVRFPSSLKSGMVLLPDGSGGYQAADALTVTITHEGQVYRLKKMTPEQRRRRKAIHSLVAIAVAIVLIYLTLQTLGLNVF